ncbi:MAG: ZIP family metal transporter [Candidatus Spechtbacterales bacterium]
MLYSIIFFSLIASLLSMMAGLFILWKHKLAKKLSFFLISFAAGVLLGVAFLDLLHEAIEGLGSVDLVAIIVLVTILVFFAIERFLWWYHHHRFHAEDEHDKEHILNRGQAYLLVSGDALHNFVDGALIAAAFMTDFYLGIAVTIGIIAHEVPQEIADFSIMLNAGLERKKVFMLNLGAALTNPLGAIIAFFAFSFIDGITPYALAVAMGVFIYIALSDLIPALHHNEEHKHDIGQLAVLIGGVALMFYVSTVLSLGHINGDNDHGHVREVHDEQHHDDEYGDVNYDNDEQHHGNEDNHEENGHHNDNH